MRPREKYTLDQLSKCSGAKRFYKTMAIRKEIRSYSIGDLEASYQVDTGMEPGGENYVVIELESGRITRTFYFEENPRAHCTNFVKKVARNEEYRAKCLSGDVRWAKIGDAYWEYHGKVYSAFSPLNDEAWGDKFQEAKGKAHNFCEVLYDRLSDLFKEVEDPAQSSIEAVTDQVQSEAKAAASALKERATTGKGAMSVGAEMTFGKHEGRSLIEIARKDPGYAEWATSELSGRPEVRKGLEEALRQVQSEDR